jgi:3-methyladenine DNA glycosylase AlkD
MTSESRVLNDIVVAIAATDGSIPELRVLRRYYSVQLSHLSGHAMLSLARRLLRPDDLARFMAYELVRFHAAAFSGLGEVDVVALGEGMSSWGAVDSFAFYIAGPAWKRRQITDRAVLSWAGANDRWWRRAALASTVTLNRKPVAENNMKRTLSVCARLVKDRDDMVVKAMSWALRELAKADADAAEHFLSEHAGALHARVRREVTNKLRTGLKVPRNRPGA